MFCRSCSEILADEAVICPKCGVATENNKKSETEVSKGALITSYVTAILIPFVGAAMGIYLLVKKQIGHGIGALVLSAFMFFFWQGFWPAFTRALH